MFRYLGNAITDIGLRRSSNQDNYLYNEELDLFVVADGMGGHSGGETASRIAIETVESFYQKRSSVPSGEPAEELDILRQAIEAANSAIYDYAEEHFTLRGMGTTIVAMRVLDDLGLIAHVGDSRLYRLDVEAIRRVTKDHSRVQELIDAKQLTEKEAEMILGRNIITRALGNRPQVEVDTQVIKLHPAEGYLLCSDGLCGVIQDDVTLDICRRSKQEINDTLEKLVDAVKENGAPDNVTAILVVGPEFGEGVAEIEEAPIVLAQKSIEDDEPESLSAEEIVEAPGEAETTRLSPHQLNQIRASHKRPPVQSVAQAADSAQSPSEGGLFSGRNLLILTLACLILAVGFLLLGPSRSRMTIVEVVKPGWELRIQEVGMPFSPEFSKTLLESGLGPWLSPIRSNQSVDVRFPVEVPEDEWAQIPGCGFCSSVPGSSRLVVEEKENALELGSQLFLGFGDLHRAKDRDKARKIYEAGEKLFKSPELRQRLAEEFFHQALAFQEEENFEKAFENYQQARELGSKAPDLYFRLGEVSLHYAEELLEAEKIAEAGQILQIAEQSGYAESSELNALKAKLDAARDAQESQDETEDSSGRPPKLEISSTTSFDDSSLTGPLFEMEDTSANESSDSEISPE